MEKRRTGWKSVENERKGWKRNGVKKCGKRIENVVKKVGGKG